MTEAGKLFFTVAEISAKCGWSRPTTYRLIKRGELPAVRIAGSTRIPAAAFDRWADRKSHESLDTK